MFSYLLKFRDNINSFGEVIPKRAIRPLENLRLACDHRGCSRTSVASTSFVRISASAAIPQFPGSPAYLPEAQSPIQPIADDPGIGVPPCARPGSLGDRVILAFQRNLSIPDRSAKLPPIPRRCADSLLQAPDSFLRQMHRVTDRLLQNFIHIPDHRSRLIFDLDSSVVTVFGRQERCRGRLQPPLSRQTFVQSVLLCIEANSLPISGIPNCTSRQQRQHMGWQRGIDGDSAFLNVPRDIREIRVRADAGFGFHPVLEILEARAADYAVVARLTQAFNKRLLPGLGYVDR